MLMPLNFKDWIDENKHLLKPPVGNKVIWKDGEFICMVVGGPNQRTDYHYEEGPEFFYQVEGDMGLKIIEDGVFLEIRINEGEIFQLPPKVPHSPQRFENTVGLVIERQRLPHEKDGLLWFCENCQHKLYDEFFHLVDIETQLTPIFDRFYGDVNKRTCENCGQVHPAPARYL